MYRLDNSIAERINGIMKDEYLFNYKPKNLQEAKIILDKSVVLYNNVRPHNSIGNNTPNKVYYDKILRTKRLWKSYCTNRERKLTKIINQ